MTARSISLSLSLSLSPCVSLSLRIETGAREVWAHLHHGVLGPPWGLLETPSPPFSKPNGIMRRGVLCVGRDEVVHALVRRGRSQQRGDSAGTARQTACTSPRGGLVVVRLKISSRARARANTHESCLSKRDVGRTKGTLRETRRSRAGVYRTSIDGGSVELRLSPPAVSRVAFRSSVSFCIFLRFVLPSELRTGFQSPMWTFESFHALVDRSPSAFQTTLRSSSHPRSKLTEKYAPQLAMSWFMIERWPRSFRKW